MPKKDPGASQGTVRGAAAKVGKTTSGAARTAGKASSRSSRTGRFVKSAKDGSVVRETSDSVTIRKLSGRILSKLAETVVPTLSDAEIDEIATESAGLLSTKLRRGDNSLAQRIGPTYRVEQLTRYLPGTDAPSLTGEAVRKRVGQRRLVAFLSRDRVWLFPEWQFATAVGRLVPIDAVVQAWADLPHDGALADVDLVSWMATRRKDLDGLTPAQWARSHGYDDRLRRAVHDVHRRAA